MAEGGSASTVCVVGVSAHVGLMCSNVSVSPTGVASFISNSCQALHALAMALCAASKRDAAKSIQGLQAQINELKAGA